MSIVVRSASSALFVALSLVTAPPARAQLPPPSAGTIAAGIVPGDWMRVTRSVRAAAPDSVPRGDSVEVVEGVLLGLDSSGVTIRPDGGAERLVRRAELRRLEVRAGRSRWMPALFGYLGALPVSLVICANERYECDKGSIPPLIGGIIGYAIGRTRWQEVRLP
jgi:hypothetical protein